MLWFGKRRRYVGSSVVSVLGAGGETIAISALVRVGSGLGIVGGAMARRWASEATVP